MHVLISHSSKSARNTGVKDLHLWPMDRSNSLHTVQATNGSSDNTMGTSGGIRAALKRDQ